MPDRDDRDDKRRRKCESPIADAIRDGISEIICALKHFGQKPKGHFDLSFGLPTKKDQNHMAVEVKITNEQKIDFTLNPKTDAGKPAKVDPNNPPTVTVIDGDSTVVVAADGLSGTLVSSDNPGDTNYLVKGDADLGEGVEEISEVITLKVAGANAKNLGIAFGAPVPK